MTTRKLRMLINTYNRIGTINKNIYGQFIEQTGRSVYDGLYVGEDSPIPNKNGVRLDVLEAFRDIKVPLLHWPGGYTTEFYHWRNGIGPKEKRARIPDTLTGRDSGIPQYVDDNAFGTHEFMNLCEELNAEPYIVFGSGQVSVEEIHDWVEYMTFDGDSSLSRLRRENGRDKPWKLRYMAIGNEWWFYETAQSYMARYCRGIHFAKNYSCPKPFRILRGPQMEDIRHTDALIDALPPDFCDAITLYMVMSVEKFGLKPHAVDFDENEYYASLQYIPLAQQQLERHLGVIRKNPHNDKMKICVDEWGCWHDTGKDSNWSMRTTMRDAVIAAAVLNTFNRNCDYIEMASLCMPVNSLHCILQTQGDKLVKTPTFYVFKQYLEHQDAVNVYSYVEECFIEGPQMKIPMVSHSVSVKDGKLLISLVNCSLSETVEIDGTVTDDCYTKCTGEILQAAPQTENTFDSPYLAVTKPFTDFSLNGQKYAVNLPPCSVVTLTLSGE